MSRLNNGEFKTLKLLEVTANIKYCIFLKSTLGKKMATTKTSETEIKRHLMIFIKYYQIKLVKNN